jgi:DNA-binding transcriptional LysR family regulator
VQSNVTARIRGLEEALGCTLFERHRSGVTLTAAGQRLLPYARRLQALLAEAAQAARDDGTPRGPLIIGSLETTAALRLSPLLGRYVAAWPEVDLAIRPGTTAELVDSVLEHRLDGAFVCGPVAHPALDEQVMFEEELVLLAAPSVASVEAAVEGGRTRIVVLRAGCSYRQRLEMLLVRRGVAVPRLMEFGTLEAIFGCVAAGLGITLLPRALIGTVWRAGLVSLHRLPAEEAMVTTVFIHRREAHVSSALRAFLDHVRAGALTSQLPEEATTRPMMASGVRRSPRNSQARIAAVPGTR